MPRVTSGHRGMTPYMAGKHDYAGRLLTDAQREELKFGKTLTKLRTMPNSPSWDYLVDDVHDAIYEIIGEDAWNTWLEDHQATLLAMTKEQQYDFSLAKLNEFRQLNHAPIVADRVQVL